MLCDRQSVAPDRRTPSRPEIGRRRRTVGLSSPRIARPTGRPLLVLDTTHDLWPANDIAPVLVRDMWVAAKPTR